MLHTLSDFLEVEVDVTHLSQLEACQVHSRGRAAKQGKAQE